MSTYRARPGISAPLPPADPRSGRGGYIRGYHADVNHEALGYGVTVFAQVGPDQPGGERPQGFQPGRELARSPQLPVFGR